MSLYEAGLRAKLIPCDASKKCGGKPFIQDKILFEDTEHYKKGCNACGGMGVQVILEPPVPDWMKFTEKDINFYKEFMDTGGSNG